MAEPRHYISLVVKGGNAFHKNGERLVLMENIASIGDSADCDVRFENNGWKPECYASIIRNPDGVTWRIVRRSQHVEMSIAGKGSVGYAHQLEDGDLIEFGNTPVSLAFHEHFDSHYKDADGRKSLLAGAVAGLLGLVAIMAVVLGRGGQEGITAGDVEPLEASIFMIKVDSVGCILSAKGKERQLFPMKVLAEESPTGTAFLTTDGMMVTARHCVEYWIGENLDLTTKVGDLPVDNIVRWAIEVETFNQTHSSDSSMILKVYFSLYDFMGNKRFSFASTDRRVHMNKDRDGLFMLADFSQDYYWRSVRPYFKDRQMELGDILWIDSMEEKGSVALAGEEEMRLMKNGTKLMVCGYPMTGMGDKRMTFTEGTIRRDASAGTENLFFESNINHGFSGGPVLVKFKGGILAAGVVSRVDSISSGLYKWAVPVTEIRNSDE